MVERSSILRLCEVTKAFGRLTAVNRIDLEIHDGEFFTIVGPSGSGKTTLLRMLAGMDTPTSGDILLNGKRINDLPANQRPTCMVFQSLALFPHRSVGQNIEFPMKIRGDAAAVRKKNCLKLMQQLRLPVEYYGKNVTQCSGGERQRVALARALAYDPEILFFDEPLSAIDYKLRKALEKELKDIHRETGKTFVYITHSLEEAMVMSDRIGVMRAGSLVQVGTPDQIYNQPSNKFVAEFMGEVNLLDIRRGANGGVVSDIAEGEFSAPTLPDGFTSGHLVVRPESMRFLEPGETAENHLRGMLYNEYALGSRFQYQVRVGDHVFIIEKLREQAYRGALDNEVLIGWDAKDSIVVGD